MIKHMLKKYNLSSFPNTNVMASFLMILRILPKKSSGSLFLQHIMIMKDIPFYCLIEEFHPGYPDHTS